jgi:hypothetical protein
VVITNEDFDLALTKVFPSVSKQDELKYKSLEGSLRKTRASLK